MDLNVDELAFKSIVWSQQTVHKYEEAVFPPFNATEIDGVYVDSVHYVEGSMAGTVDEINFSSTSRNKGSKDF